MPSLRLYTDSHIPKAVSEQLRIRGVDVVRCQEVGFADESDLFHLEHASGEGRAVVTGDIDFLRLHSDWQERGRRHAGIFFIHPQVARQGMEAVGILVHVLQFYAEALAEGAASLEQDLWNQAIYITGL